LRNKKDRGGERKEEALYMKRGFSRSIIMMHTDDFPQISGRHSQAIVA
jgi:hypothetical protein